MSEHELLEKLPMIDEHIDQVNSHSDVFKFVEYYTEFFGENELKLFILYVRESQLLSCKNIIPVKFHESLVGALKHTFAYERLLHALSSRDDVNALGVPYLMEAQTDIEAAILLISKGYNKLTLQILRSALETSVTHAYLTSMKITYDELNDLYIPPMKDRKRGMINHLVEAQVFTPKQASMISTNYSELSNAIHSQFRHIENKFKENIDLNTISNTILCIRDIAICCIIVMLQMKYMKLN